MTSKREYEEQQSAIKNAESGAVMGTQAQAQNSLQHFSEGTPASIEDFERFRSPSLVGVFPYRDLLFLVAEHLGIEVDEHLDLHVSNVAAMVVGDLGEHRTVAGYRFTRWRTRRDPFGTRRREAMHEAM